jgi:MCP family monocarboxylic acid transporter-like MFS transporter 10
MAVLGHWFRLNRALAIGLAASGSSLGGLVFPIILRYLIPLLGFRWTVRILGLVVLLLWSELFVFGSGEGEGEGEGED